MEGREDGAMNDVTMGGGCRGLREKYGGDEEGALMR